MDETNILTLSKYVDDGTFNSTDDYGVSSYAHYDKNPMYISLIIKSSDDVILNSVNYDETLFTQDVMKIINTEVLAKLSSNFTPEYRLEYVEIVIEGYIE